MITTFILVLFAFFALAGLTWLIKGHTGSSAVLENPTQHIHSVDVEAFRNLVDPDEEQFLRTYLPPTEFRRIQRERLRAAAEYVSCAAKNAAILVRVADAGRRSSDPSTAEAAEKLVDNAIRLRLYASLAIPRLYLGMILPGTHISPVRIAESYEQMTRLAVLLSCLQYPTRGISSAL